MEKENFYKVEIEKAVGSCDSNIFKKMASKGAVNAKSITTLIDKVVTVSGYAKVHITTKDKDFKTYYIATYDGLYFSTGSEYFIESLADYLDDITTFRIVEVKTKKGKTYKASPVLQQAGGNFAPADEPVKSEDLPF